MSSCAVLVGKPVLHPVLFRLKSETNIFFVKDVEMKGVMQTHKNCPGMDTENEILCSS